MLGGKVELTDEEIEATLSRTLIPTVVVEGKGDLFLFRRIEAEIGASNLSLLAVGGRSRVISTFEKFESTAIERNLFFFCDKDEWEFCGIPQRFDHPNFETTDGYSIENDLLRDGNAISYLYPNEATNFWNDIRKFCDWFAVQMARFLRNEGVEISKFPDRILDDDNEYQLDCQLRDGEEQPLALKAEIASDPMKKLRGKSLIQILGRQLNAPRRAARHNPNSLLEHGAAVQGGHFARVHMWLMHRLES